MTAARKALGAFGEDKAAAWYERNGYRVVARNWRCRDGELDIVARRGSTVVFCEVKTRASAAFGVPAEAVTVGEAAQAAAPSPCSGCGPPACGPASSASTSPSVLGGKLEIIEAAF